MSTRTGTIVAMTLASLASGALARQIGDEGTSIDASMIDSRFTTQMNAWAMAGVEGGIPLRSSRPATVTIKPGDNIQEAIDGLGSSGGVVKLSAGEYLAGSTVHLRSNVILRGDRVWNTKIRFTIDQNSTSDDGIVLDGCTNVGLEGLTAQHYRASQIDANDLYWYSDNAGNAEIVPSDGQKLGTGQWTLCTIRNSKNCWIDGCEMSYTFEHPIRIVNSSHITCRGNYVLASQRHLIFNKNYSAANTHGSYLLDSSTNCLLYRENIRGVGALTLSGADNNVVINCRQDVPTVLTGGARTNLLENTYCELHRVYYSNLFYNLEGAIDNWLYNCHYRATRNNNPPLPLEKGVIYKAAGAGRGELSFEVISEKPPAGGTLYAAGGDRDTVYEPRVEIVRVTAGGEDLGVGFADIKNSCQEVTFYADMPMAEHIRFVWDFGAEEPDTLVTNHATYVFAEPNIYSVQVRAIVGNVTTQRAGIAIVWVNTGCEQGGLVSHPTVARAARYPAAVRHPDRRALWYDLRGRAIISPHGRGRQPALPAGAALPAHGLRAAAKATYHFALVLAPSLRVPFSGWSPCYSPAKAP